MDPWGSAHEGQVAAVRRDGRRDVVVVARRGRQGAPFAGLDRAQEDRQCARLRCAIDERDRPSVRRPRQPVEGQCRIEHGNVGVFGQAPLGATAQRRHDDDGAAVAADASQEGESAPVGGPRQRPFGSGVGGQLNRCPAADQHHVDVEVLTTVAIRGERQRGCRPATRRDRLPGRGSSSTGTL